MTAPGVAYAPLGGRARAGAALRRAGPLALAGAGANGLSVLVTIGVARLLSARAYGAMSQLVGLYLVLSTPGSALLIAVVRRVTAWDASERHALVGPWVERIRRNGAFGLLAFAAVALAVRSVVARELTLPGPEGVAEVLIAGGGWALLSVERGLIQSRLAYGALARNLGVEAGSRAVITLVTIGLGLGVEGAALGLVGAVGVALVDARLSLHRIHRLATAAPSDPQATGPSLPPDAGRPTAGGRWAGRQGMALDLSTAIAALALLACLQSVDVVILGRQAPGNAGAYAAISVACKALVFLAIALAGYLLPEAVTRWHRGGHALGPLAIAAGLVSIPGAVLLVITLVAPKLLLRTVFGPDLTGAAPAFSTLCLAMGCLAAAVLLTNYLLGIGRRSVVLVLFVALAGVGILVVRAHGDPVGTARAELAGQASLVAGLGLLVAHAHRSRAHGLMR